MVQNLGMPMVHALKIWFNFNYCIGLMRDKVAQLHGRMGLHYGTQSKLIVVASSEDHTIRVSKFE